MNIKFNDISKQWDCISKDAMPRITKFLEDGNYMNGDHVDQFEKLFSEYTGSKYSIGVSNGTDGLRLALECLHENNKFLGKKVAVIIPANTYIADALIVSQYNREFEIILTECDDYYQMDMKQFEITFSKNLELYDRIYVIAVHLYGHPCNMNLLKDTISSLDNNNKTFIIEDVSQAHGAEIFYNIKMGSLSDLAVYSLYPGKNLGAAGDAGIITTNREDYARYLKGLRNYGSHIKYQHDYKGYNNRLDNIQAIILQEKLKKLENWNEKKRNVAKLYEENLKELKQIILPKLAEYVQKHAYHIYCIRTKQIQDRDRLIEYLKQKNIPTVIHYTVSIECTNAYKQDQLGNHEKTRLFSQTLVSLPMHPFLQDEEVTYICNTIKSFFNETN
jgi:dTDP-4-amino-4,6-dideoxygalactose transaminase